MSKDKRYITVGHLIKDGRITCFQEIFNILPKSVMAADLWMNNTRFEKVRNNVTLFKVKELFRIASLFEVSEMETFALVYNQYVTDKKEKGKRI